MDQFTLRDWQSIRAAVESDYEPYRDMTCLHREQGIETTPHNIAMEEHLGDLLERIDAHIEKISPSHH